MKKLHSLSQVFATFRFFILISLLVISTNDTIAQGFALFSKDTNDYSSYSTELPTKSFYSIKNKLRPDLVVGFADQQTDDTNLLSLTNTQTKGNQFVIEQNRDGIVRIKSIVTGKYLEISEDMAVHGSAIVQGEARNSPSQQFQLIALGDGYYTLVSLLNYNLAVEISDQSMYAPLRLGSRRKSDMQAFKLTKN